MVGPGTGVYRDDHATNPEQRYVAFGTFCPETSKPCQLCNRRMADCAEKHEVNKNLAVSHDGLVWHKPPAADWNLSWPFPHCYDDHNNIFHDSRLKRWIATTRIEIDFDPSQDGERSGRMIGIAASTGDNLTFNTNELPAVTLPMTGALQLYSQITFPWHNTCECSSQLSFILSAFWLEMIERCPQISDSSW